MLINFLVLSRLNTIFASLDLHISAGRGIFEVGRVGQGSLDNFTGPGRGGRCIPGISTRIMAQVGWRMCESSSFHTYSSKIVQPNSDVDILGSGNPKGPLIGCLLGIHDCGCG